MDMDNEENSIWLGIGMLQGYFLPSDMFCYDIAHLVSNDECFFLPFVSRYVSIFL